MRAFLPSSPSSRTHSTSSAVVTPNASYLSTQAVADAALVTKAAAEAMMARSVSSSGLMSPMMLSSTARENGDKRRESKGRASTAITSTHSQNSNSRSTSSTALVPFTSKETEIEMFPSWIRERKDFQVFFPRYSDRIITDDEILRQGVPKEPNERNIVELQCLARWIMRIPSMQASLDLSQATEIAKLARYQVFKPGEFIFRKGDNGDACYLVFSGEVQVLIDGEKVASVTKNSAFGDIALQIENATRGADVQAIVSGGYHGRSSGPFSPLIIPNVEVLKILATDYHKTLARCQSRRRKHLVSWLHTEVTLFRDCVESKLHYFELVSIDVPLKKGQVLYRQGDSVGAFYVVRSGRVRMEVDIQYEHKHRWPCGPHEWKEKVHAVTSQITFTTEPVAGFFGFEMFVEGQQTRAYTAIADSEDCELVALNRVDCFSPYFSFTSRAIDKILEKHDKYRELSIRQIQQKMKEFRWMTNQHRKSYKTSNERLPVILTSKFQNSTENPQYQFPILQAAEWEAQNEVVRAFQLACQ